MQYPVLLTFLILIQALPSFGQNHLRSEPDSCSLPLEKQPLEQVLPCYLIKPDPTVKYEVQTPLKIPEKQIIRHDMVISHNWETGRTAGVDHPQWKHRIQVFIPKKINHTTALLYINGGTLYPEQASSDADNKEIDFARIANTSRSIVINLMDIPNQYMTFNQTKPLKEDYLIAYTWQKFIDNPDKNRHWPLQLPMTKSVIHTMDIIQRLQQEKGWNIDNFVVSGGSKRGWIAWLVAAMDKRITAVVPMVIEVLNIRPSMNHHNSVYGDWADPVKRSYGHLMQELNTDKMNQLSTIVDPYSYRDNLSLPKYIISASADDFFLPDSAQFYFKDLPGKKWMRVLPNLRHYIVWLEPELVTNTLLSLYGSFINKKQLPELSVEMNKDELLVNSSIEPSEINIWWAYNPSARDFRITQNNPKFQPFKAMPISFKCEKDCNVNIKLDPPNKGWDAYFVEARYSNKPFPDFVLTSQVFIVPNILAYPAEQLPINVHD